MRRRLDVELVRRGLAPSREQAQADIAAGRVLVAGATADRPARMVETAEPVEMVGPPPRFVSRGGEKLDAALEAFGVDVAGKAVLDAGAAHGGFTDCVLQRGAASVLAVDVGHGQLDYRLRHDPRVTVLERTNVRNLDPHGGAAGSPSDPPHDPPYDPPYDVVVADLSFISLRTVADVLVGLTAPGGDLVVLIKPQFEAGRVEASRAKGVIRDEGVRRQAVDQVVAAFAAQGTAMMGCMESPITGAAGNVEFLAHLRRGA